jgi:DNA polymerase phi
LNDIVFELHSKKSWLKEECGWVLCNALQILQIYQKRDDKKTMQKLKPFVEYTLNELESLGLSKTPEGIAIWIAARSVSTNIVYPKNVFRDDDPFNSKGHTVLVKAMKGASKNSQDVSQSSLGSTWSHKLHFAWEVIFSALLEPNGNPARFSALWREFVDGLFSYITIMHPLTLFRGVVFKCCLRTEEVLGIFTYTKIYSHRSCVLHQIYDRTKFSSLFYQSTFQR